MKENLKIEKMKTETGKMPTKFNRWYVYIKDDWTEQIMRGIKEQSLNHDTNYGLLRKVEGSPKPLNLWDVDFEEIQKLASGKILRNLKFEIYLEQFHGKIVRWEQPTRGNKNFKIILPLYPMAGDIENSRKEITRISRIHSSDNISLLPVYVTLSEMMENEDDIEQLRRGFRTVEALITRKTFDQIWLFGNKITKGMEKIILFCNFLNVPIRIKGQSKFLKQDFAGIMGM